MEFKPAKRKRAKIRLALAGPSGAGKTYSALLIAKGLGGRIALIDTERGSASLYSHLVDFDTLELNPPYTPERFIEAMKAASGYDVIVIDSITHEWDGAGGCLESNEVVAHAKFKGNTWAAWNETTPRHQAFIDAMMQSQSHVIATMRSKTETIQVDGKVKKLGMKAVQRDNVEYEFGIVFDIERDKHWALAGKDRTELFPEPHVITTETGERIAKWLESGENTKVPEGARADHLAAMEAAADMAGLQTAFKAAWKAAADDPDARTAFQKRYDARKAILAAKAVA